MAITAGFPNQAKQDFLDGVHQTSDTYKMAFYMAASASFDLSSTVYSATGEVTNGSVCPAGGVTLTGRTSGISSTTGYIDFGDVSFTVTGSFSADSCIIYNSTRSNKIVGIFSFGSTKTATDGPFQVQIPSSGTGVIRFA
jgi:hypothetical protein